MEIFAVVSDVVWQALIAAVVTIVMAWMQQRNNTATKTAQKVAETHAIEIKAGLDLATKTADAHATAIKAGVDTAAKTAEAVHVLVNSNMGAQLKLCAIALGRVAELTEHPDDELAAKLAQQKLDEHEGKQAALDAKTTSGETK